ncbi:MAG: thermonuclease family protein [Armatimonadota bacterium]|nr:thermonuclease family protein [bacterium]
MLKRILATFLLIFATAGLACCAPETFSGTVTAVTDGDTLQLDRDGKTEKVRLYGIDAPEMKQDYGAQARQAVIDLALGKLVRVEVLKSDQYRRTVGVVTLPGNVNLNQEMVKSGLAWWYRDVAPKSVQLPRLQDAAMGVRLGLWSKPDPTPPWEFRSRGSGDKTAEASKCDHGNVQPVNDGIVYVSESGKCYHRENCCTMRRSKLVMMTLSEAIAAHYRPCKICKPK